MRSAKTVRRRVHLAESTRNDEGDRSGACEASFRIRHWQSCGAPGGQAAIEHLHPIPEADQPLHPGCRIHPRCQDQHGLPATAIGEKPTGIRPDVHCTRHRAFQIGRPTPCIQDQRRIGFGQSRGECPRTQRRKCLPPGQRHERDASSDQQEPDDRRGEFAEERPHRLNPSPQRHRV